MGPRPKNYKANFREIYKNKLFVKYLSTYTAGKLCISYSDQQLSH